MKFREGSAYRISYPTREAGIRMVLEGVYRGPRSMFTMDRAGAYFEKLKGDGPPVGWIIPVELITSAEELISD